MGGAGEVSIQHQRKKNSTFATIMKANDRIRDAFEALIAAEPEAFQDKLKSLVKTFYDSGGRRPGEIDSFDPLRPQPEDFDPDSTFKGDENAAHRVMCTSASPLEIARQRGANYKELGIPELWPSLTADAQGWCRMILKSPIPKHLSDEGLVDLMAAKGYVCTLIDAFDWLNLDRRVTIIGRKGNPPSKSDLLEGGHCDD